MKERQLVRGTTVRSRGDDVQIAFFDEQNKYAAIVVLSKREAAKLKSKLARFNAVTDGEQ